MRGVRGAITIKHDTENEVIAATIELLTKLVDMNDMKSKDISSIFFSTTPDVTSEFPAVAARKLGWHKVPMLCAHEMNVPKGMKKCIRVLIHWNTHKSQDEIKHVYLKDAKQLRPDL